MKRYFYFLIFLSLTISCSKDSTISETSIDVIDDVNDVTNLPPNEFNITVINVSHDSVTLTWNESTDPEGDNILYDIYLNQELIAENILELTYEINNLLELTEYSGEVKAKDSLNNETVSNFSFVTDEYYLKYLKMYDFGPLNFNSGYASGRPFSLIKTNDNNYVIAGSKEEQFGDGNDFFVIKIDPEGNEIWKKTINYQAGDAWNFKIIESSNGFLLAGFYHLFNLDQNGNIIWYKKIDSYETSYGGFEIKSLARDNQGNIYLVGSRISSDSEVIDESSIVKLNSSGQIIWERVYKPSLINSFNDIKINSNNELIILGSGESSGLTMQQYQQGGGDSSLIQIDFWVIKTDLNGDMIWENYYGDWRYDFPSEMILKTNGNYAFAGYSWGAYDVSSGRLFEIDSDGNELWNTSNNLSAIYSCKESLDGGFIATGIVETGGAGNFGALGIYKFDSQGNEEWNKKHYGDFERLFGRSVLTEDDGGYRIAGDLSKNFYYGDDKPQLLIYKTDQEGNFD